MSRSRHCGLPSNSSPISNALATPWALFCGGAENASATKEMQQVRESHDQRTAAAQSRKLIADGVAALKSGRATDAKSAFDKAAGLSPADPAAYYYQGPLKRNSLILSKPLCCLPKLSRLNRTMPPRICNSVSCTLVPKTTKPLWPNCAAAVSADTDSAEAHYNLAKLLALLGHSDESLSELQDCLAIDPSLIEARMLLGNLLADHGDSSPRCRSL